MVLLGSFTPAYGNTNVDMYSDKNYTESTNFGDLLTDFISSVFSNKETQIQSKGSTLEVTPPFIIAPLHSEASIFSSIVSWVFVYTNVTVEGYNGNYIKVKVNKTDKRGYIHKFLLTVDKSYLVQQSSNVYVGKSKKILKDYNNPEDFTWSVSQDGIISLNKQTGEIKGLKPGTVTVTAKYNGKTDECIVSSINQWKETESSSATKDITVKSNPDSSDYDNFTKGTIPSGATIVARGDMADGSGWIYISDKAESVWGFIKLSDFPGIDYLMTQYHYYDEGHEERFSSSESKIYDYTSVLNDVMMANFKLKVCSYVYPYTSVADKCKKLSYGDVSKNNISKSCPKTSGHKNDSCLKSIHLRDDLKKQFGNGGGPVSKVAWTGHLMSDYENDRSNSTVGMGSIIMNPYGTINSTTIRKDRLYTLTHETGHQLSLNDHYCYENKESNGGVCKNPYCSDCNGEPLPVGCIMLERINVENATFTKIYCDKCQNNILNYIEYF